MANFRTIHSDLNFVIGHNYQNPRAVILAMANEIDGLRKALAKYGRHLGTVCEPTSRGCKCGLNNKKYEEDNRKHCQLQDVPNP